MLKQQSSHYIIIINNPSSNPVSNYSLLYKYSLKTKTWKDVKPVEEQFIFPPDL